MTTATIEEPSERPQPQGPAGPADPASAFVRAYFGDSTESAVFLSSLPDKKSDRPGEIKLTTRDLAAVAAFCAQHDKPGRGHFFCTATVQPGAQNRNKTTLAELPALFIDIDFKSAAETSPADAMRILKELEFPQEHNRQLRPRPSCVLAF